MKVLIEDNTVVLEYSKESDLLCALSGFIGILKISGFKDEVINVAVETGLNANREKSKEEPKSGIKDLLRSLGMEV